MHLLEDYSPQVVHAGRGCFYLDVTGSPPATIGRTLQERLRHDLGLTASLGVAANRLVAGIAAQSQAPGGLSVVPMDQEAGFLAPLPIAYLFGLQGPVSNLPLRERLLQLGIKKIGDIQMMSEGLLEAQLGKEGKRLYLLLLAQGMAEPPAAETIAVEEVFDHRLGDPAAVRRWAILLCGQVGQQLRAARQEAGRLALTLGHPERSPTVCMVRLAKPSDVDQAFFEAITRTLDGCHLPGEGVVSLELEACDLREAREQISLVPDVATTREAKLRQVNRAANSIQHRHGESAILVASVLGQDILARLHRKGAI
jgi:DNA polymerase-4